MRRTKVAKANKAPILGLTLVAFACAAASVARASTIDVQSLTTDMIENQLSDALNLGLNFGGDSSSPIMFTSNVNLSAGSYSFQSLSGETYKGQAVTIDGTGVFDSLTSIITTSQTIVLGSTSFSGSGTDTLDLTSDPVTNDLVVTWAPNMKAQIVYNDTECLDLVNKKTGASISSCFLTLDGKRVAGPFADIDQYPVKNTTGAWTSSTFFDGIGVSSIGNSPLVGGAGTFTTTVNTPEPSTWAMILLGFAGLGFVGYRSRRVAVSAL